MKLYHTVAGVVLERAGEYYAPAESWDVLINRPGLYDYLVKLQHARLAADFRLPALRAPVGTGFTEVWAAGVTYWRSRTARIEESRDAGGGSFYDRVYEAERPELFFKAPAWRVIWPGAFIRVRQDSRWSVPEPELAACFNNRGELIGFTIGNDVSARDIEGENPLYLPQAKIYDGSCALGPALYVTPDPLPPETTIGLVIRRGDDVAFEGSTTLAQLRRTPAELGAFLFRETSFPAGCVLLTGTGIVPPDDFTLASGDQVAITVEPIGTLVNRVA
jgi:2-dehydro-3-deoxy-D-arabinonate dehydratase